MKIAKHLSLIIALISTVNCSMVKTETSNIALQNANLVQESSNSQIPESAAVALETQAPEGGKQLITPDSVISDLYKTHEKNGAILSGKNRTLLDKYFDKNLADLIWKDLTTHPDDVGVIDVDPFYNTQDPDIKNLKVSPARIEGAKATVPVNFTNGGVKETVTYQLVRQNSAWKISDIKYGEGRSLLKYFKEDEQNNSSSAANNNSAEDAMFEGTYQVGNTTATVKPIKMAFELKWAKGSGTMLFFYTGQGVLEYSSEDKGNGVDTFVFEDSTFTTGKFVRADGKEMPVKKIG